MINADWTPYKADQYLGSRRDIPPKCFADKGHNGVCAFVLLLMVLTRIPPEPGFFLPFLPTGQCWTRASGNRRWKFSVVCSAKRS